MQKNRKNQRSRRSGLTLIEVMIVLLILAMLAAVLIVNVRGQQARAQKLAAFNVVKALENAVEQYIATVGQPPTTEQGLQALLEQPQGIPEGKWAGPYLRSNIKTTDPWGNEYQYLYPGRRGGEYDIWSYGPDLMDGTDDDIGNWMNDI